MFLRLLREGERWGLHSQSLEGSPNLNIECLHVPKSLSLKLDHVFIGTQV